jgi:hypothetical protein
MPSYPVPPFYPEFIIPGVPSITESPAVTTEENGSLGLDEATAAFISATANENNDDDYEEEEEEEEDEDEENGGDY